MEKEEYNLKGQINRQTRFELLRIISMLMIVAGHSVVHGNYSEFPLSMNGAFAIALTQGARIGVDIFVILTGYFSVGKKISLSKMKSQCFQIWTYSIIITALMMAIGEIQFNAKLVVWALLPISTSQYWFATCYILLLLISPCLQICIENLGKKQYQKILIIMGVLWSLIPTLINTAPGYSNFVWFIYVYMLAAYFRKYGLVWISKIRIWHGVFVLLMICVSAISVYYIGDTIPLLKDNAIYLFAEMNKLPAILCALLLFFGFRNWDVKQSKVINIIASCTLGVYLLHDNPNIRRFLWCDLLKNSNYITKEYFALRISLCIIAVFAIGILIDWIRQYVMKEVINVFSKSKE